MPITPSIEGVPNILDLASKEVCDLVIETYNTVTITCYCTSLCQSKVLGRKALPIKTFLNFFFTAVDESVTILVSFLF